MKGNGGVTGVTGRNLLRVPGDLDEPLSMSLGLHGPPNVSETPPVIASWLIPSLFPVTGTKLHPGKYETLDRLRPGLRVDTNRKRGKDKTRGVGERQKRTLVK